MEKIMLIGATEPHTWGWDMNPVNGKEYNLKDIPSMYGEGFFEFFTLENFLDTWQDEHWMEDHGKWVVVVEGKGGE